ncbi:hypothetical protein QOL99_00330 [Deinococcus sp. MIMF12]|uniref:Replication protein n=1 Tax=Deinococcus rhizophilus TaxID=3049544 RepID=A0ABT7JC38_9DEIO|nr:hypothetical protein [Deinococcus rhizophilus]MDL2342595.1 hypothetical protein [Deinococcus rhizophilus]
MRAKNRGVALVAQFMGREKNIPVPVPFVYLLGDYTAAAFLSQCLYWSERTDNPEGWFYKTLKEWKAEMLLSPDQVRRCHKTCEPYLEVATGGENNRTHYRIKGDELEEALHLLGNPTSGYRETQQPVVGKVRKHFTTNPTTLNKEAEITSESTAEEGAKRSAAATQEAGKGQRSGSGADRAEAPGGAEKANARPASGAQSEGGHGTDQATGTEKVPARPGEAALRSAMGERFYGELLAEDPDRETWGDLTPERIGELRRAAKAEAKEKKLDAWRTPFIRLLDQEIVRVPQTPAAPAKASVSDLVRARIQGAKP